MIIKIRIRILPDPSKIRPVPSNAISINILQDPSNYRVPITPLPRSIVRLSSTLWRRLPAPSGTLRFWPSRDSHPSSWSSRLEIKEMMNIRPSSRPGVIEVTGGTSICQVHRGGLWCSDDAVRTVLKRQVLKEGFYFGNPSSVMPSSMEYACMKLSLKVAASSSHCTSTSCPPARGRWSQTSTESAVEPSASKRLLMGNAKGHCYRGGAWPLQVTTVASPSSSAANFHALGR